MQHGCAMIDAAQDAAMAAGRDIAAGPRVGLHDLARGEDCCSCITMTPARLRPCSSAQTRDAMNSTESIMFFGPSLLIWPCGRCADVAADRQGRVDQEIEPIGRFFDLRAAWVKIAPSYLPVARIRRAALVSRAKLSRGGNSPR